MNKVSPEENKLIEFNEKEIDFFISQLDFSKILINKTELIPTIIQDVNNNELLMGEADNKIPKKTAWTKNRAIVDIATNHIILDITLFGMRFNINVSEVVSQMQQEKITLLGELLSNKYPNNPSLHLDKMTNL